MNSFNRKRSPFGEAPADIDNRKNKVHGGSGNDATHKRQSSSALPKPLPRAPVSNILAKNAVRARSRSRQQLESQSQQQKPLPSPARTSTNANANATIPSSNNDATRARVYKAEAYEAKVRLASQEQRIDALHAELEEVRIFQVMEQEGNHANSEALEKQSKKDAELIEELAHELETMEKDLKASQARVGELEKNLADRHMAENETQPLEREQWKQTEIQLKKQLERKERELNLAKKDSVEGIVIMKELDGALRKARAERDDARSQVTALQTKIEQQSHGDAERMQIVKELEVALKSVKIELDEALSKSSSLQEELDKLKESSTNKIKSLENMNSELQNVLERVQNQSGKKMEQIKQGIIEAQNREESLKSDHHDLVEKYEQQLKKSQQMSTNLEAIANQFEQQKEELSLKEDAIEELEALHAKDIANLKLNHAMEIESMKEKEVQHVQEVKAKDGLVDKLKAEKDDLLLKLQQGLEIHEKTKMELEAKTLELHNFHSDSAAAQTEEDIETLKHDYTAAVKLSISRGKKIQSLEKDVETYRKAIQHLKKMDKKADVAKERLQAEVDSLRTKALKSNELISELEQELTQIDQLEVDLANATKENEEWKSRMKEIEAKNGEVNEQLQAEVESLRFKMIESEETISALEQELLRSEQLENDLANVQKKNDELQTLIKELEDKTDIANDLLQVEVESLRAKAFKSEETISELEHQLSLTEQLKLDLEEAEKKKDELEDALQEMQTALKAARRQLSPRKGPTPTSIEEKRRQIERHALQEYCAQRMFDEK